MPILEVNGREVEVDDSFLSLSPDQQNATVDEIALSLSRQGANGERVDPGHQNVPEFVPVGVEGYNPETGMVERSQNALGTFMTAGAEGVPFIGGLLDKGVLNASAGIGAVASGKSFGQVRQEMQEMRDRGREQHPMARLGGNVAGSMATLGPVARTGVGSLALGLRGPNIATRTAAAGLSSAGIVGGDTLARGGSVEGAARNAAFGSAIGMALPGAGRVINQMVSKVLAAPTMEGMREAGQALYRKAFNAGVTLTPPGFDKGLHKAAARLSSFGFDPGLHPGTASVLNRLSQARGRPIDLQELDNLRRVAMNAATGGQARGDRKAAWIVVNAIDDMVDDAASFGIGRTGAIPPPGAPATSAAEALGTLKEARSIWHRLRKSETIDLLFQRATVRADGATSGPAFATALRSEFKRQLLRKNGLRGFTEAERRAIAKAANGKTDAKVMEGLGKWMRSVAGTGVGGMGGFAFGGPAGSLAGIAAGQLTGRALQRLAARSTVKGARNAFDVVRGGGGRAYPGGVSAPLETALRPAPLVTYDRGPRR